jgi:hypothetical protein
MMLKYAIALAILLVLAAVFTWAFLPARYLPGNRARHLRISAISDESSSQAPPFSWQNTRLVSCQVAPDSRRSRSCLALCALRATMARFGRMSDRFDLGVLVSPLLLAERQTWITPLLRSTWSQVSMRSSPGRRPSVIAKTKSASNRTTASSASSTPSCERHEGLRRLGQTR